VLDGSCSALLPHTLVDAWLLETTLAVAADVRPAARRALQSALALAQPLDALRPFAQAGPGVRELLVHQLGASEPRMPLRSGYWPRGRAARTGAPR
jgi:LuxR family maltose regulon positive regulatory protein